MFYTIAILFMLSFFLLIKRHTNYYSMAFCVQIMFLNVSLLFVFVFIAKTGNYMYPDRLLYLPDYSLYLRLMKLKISLYNIIRLQNIGFAGYLACMPLFLRNSDHIKKLWKFVAAAAIMPLFYVIFYDPTVKLCFLDALYRGEYNYTVAGILKSVNVFNYIWIILYLTVPLIRLMYRYFRVKSRIKQKQLFSLFFSLLCLDMMCLNIFILGPFKQTYMNLSVDNLLCLPDTSGAYIYNSTYVPMAALLLSNIMVILLFRFRGLDKVDFFKNAQISRMALKPNKNIRNIMHTYKNEMLSVNMIARQLEDIDDPEREKHLINRLFVISDNSIANIQRITNIYKDSDTVRGSYSVVECIDNVLEKMVFDSNISVEKNIEDDAYALCDRDRLEDSLENIFINAQEAIRLANREHGLITVSVKAEFEWIFIKITDNGTGIPKKDINKIFSAFYSTKQSSKNWGIGLNFVFRSMRAMKGFVYAKSELDQYTTITLALQTSE